MSQDKRLLRRVNQELDAGNPLWQIVVNRSDWLCPYCGEIGAENLRMEESLELRIVQHLASGCPAYHDDAGEPLDQETLQSRAALIALKQRVRRALKRDPAWQVLVDDRWLCPYCARATDLKPQAIHAKTKRDMAKRLTRDVLGALKHLFRCAAYAERGGRSSATLGAPRPLEELLEARDRQARLKRAERCLERLQREPAWRHRDMDRMWMCPFCARSTDIPFPKDQEPTVELGDKLARHIDRCAAYKRLEGRTRTERYLKDRVIAINRRLILERLRRKLSSHAIWQITDADDEWYCPYCAAATGVKLPEAERAQVSDHALGEVWRHLGSCEAYSVQRAQLQPKAAILKAVAQVDRQKRLKRDVRKQLLDDPRFALHDAFGSWLCPYCRKVQKRIGVSTERSLLERTTELVMAHMTRHCTHYQEGEAPTASFEELRAIVDARPRGREAAALAAPAGAHAAEPAAALGAAPGGAMPAMLAGPPGPAGPAGPAALGVAWGAPPGAAARPAPRAETTISGRFPGLGGGGGARPGAPGGAPAGGLRRRREVELSLELEQSLEDARDRQLRLLPRLPELPGFEFGIVYQPVGRVGGDFYDFFRAGEDELGIVVGDVSGHGIEAALLVGLAKKLIEIHARGRSSPGQALLLANADIYPDLDARTFVTVFLANLSTRTRRLRFARAGHNPLVLFNPARAPRLQVLDAKGMALGMDPGPIFRTALEEVEIELIPGDLLVQYTDGVTETTNHEREEFGLERLYAVIERYGAEEAEYVLYQVERAMQDFREGARQTDDVTLLAIKVT